MKTEPKIIAKYELIKDLPRLSAGVIFEHREYDHRYPDRGNIGTGVMMLGWLNGDCQDGWCGETYILPGQLAKDTNWFKRVDFDQRQLEKESILTEIDRLKKRVELL